MRQVKKEANMAMIRNVDDGPRCNNDCGCAGGQLRTMCTADPGCSRCMPSMFGEDGVYAKMDQTHLDEATEALTEADDTIKIAQYRAVHDLLEGFLISLVEAGHLGWQSVFDKATDPGETGFEVVEAYLDQCNDPVGSIVKPDMSEFTEQS